LLHKILIVDDSALIRRALRACLEEGHQWEVCGEAGDGTVALELAKTLNPDLIVLDPLDAWNERFSTGAGVKKLEFIPADINVYWF
jgi:chemotaxis response regulator CheB